MWDQNVRAPTGHPRPIAVSGTGSEVPVGTTVRVKGEPTSVSQNSRVAKNAKASALAAGWILGTTDQRAEKYFDPKDFHYFDDDSSPPIPPWYRLVRALAAPNPKKA